MIGIFRKEDFHPLDRPITRVLEEMDLYGPDSDEFRTHMQYLERLHALKATSRRERVSPDTMAVVFGNLLGIVVMVAYEQKHVMTSKALGMLLKKNP